MISRQHDDMSSSALLASCVADLARLEKLAVRDAATSQKLASLIRSRTSEGPKAQPDKDSKILAYWESLGASGECAETELEDGQQTAALFHSAKQMIPVLVRHNTILESNCRHYEIALQSALDELLRAKGNALELQTLMNQGSTINQFLRQEHQAQQELDGEEMRLAARHEHLTALLQAAVNSKDGERNDVLIKALAHENSVLRSMLFSCRDGEGITTDSPRRAYTSSSRASRSSDDHRPSPCSPSPTSPGSPIEFPFADVPLATLPPMPPPSPPSQHREPARWKNAEEIGTGTAFWSHSIRISKLKLLETNSF